MHAHYFQHVPFEGLGSIESWLMAAGYEITSTKFFAEEALPDIHDVDLLIIMGGPMSVNDEKEFPWLVQEKQFVRDIIKQGTSVLGICLGAQLIASALGARVYQNRVKEIGWFPIHGTSPSDSSTFSLPSSTEVFHWHGETFDLPSGATRLASSEACDNQAFQLARSVIGLQFHLETTVESARDIVSHCRDELIPMPHVQSGEEILAASPEKYASINQLMSEILSYLQQHKHHNVSS